METPCQTQSRGKRQPGGRAATAVLLALACWLAGCAQRGLAHNPPAASPAGDSEAHAPPTAMHEMVVSGNRLASAAGLAVLRRGGTAIDAAVAAEAVLGLVEPQHSGPGGGSVLLSWQAASQTLTVFDGTPRAGSDTPRGLNEDAAGKPLDPRAVVHGGGAVGVPGTLPALWAAHRAQGKLPWADLLAPAIKLADDGFPVSPSLHALLAAEGGMQTYGEAAALFAGPGGGAPPLGATLRNPGYADMLRRVARLGPDGLYADGGMETMLAALARGGEPSRLTPADLHGYHVTNAAPLCAPWRDLRVCTAPPPAFGGLVALQTLIMADTGEPAPDLSDATFVHRFLDAGRLAEADRRRYVGDPAQVPVPDQALLDPAYLAARAALIHPEQAIAHARPGEPTPPDDNATRRDDPGAPATATDHLAVVDSFGNALSMSSSLTHAFGARVAAGGVPLNNALANFSPVPPKGAHYANEMAPGKRPATPLAPVMVFGADGRPVLLGGSGGGPGVPDYVAATVLDILGAHRSPAEALARPHVSSADPDHVEVEAGTSAEQLMPALAAMGHQVSSEAMPSGSAFMLRTPTGWIGAADPRRDGVALGD